MNCPICESSASPIFSAVILGKLKATFYYCERCGYLFTPDPCWLEAAYSEAISEIDTGLVMRNISIAEKLACVLYWFLGHRGKGRYVDVAGGYGLLTRIMRDYGFDFYWKDKYCDNLFARGFEVENTSGPFYAVTAIEVLEHLEDPVGFIKETLLAAKSDTFIFTTELFQGPPPAPARWWYYSFETGQHISFFQRRTLEIIADKLQMRLASAGGIHVFSRQALDERLLSLCTVRFQGLLIRLIRRYLPSRAMKDHELLVAELRRKREAPIAERAEI